MRPMRRANQALDAATCEAVLRRGRTGVLAVTGEDGWPYAVPLNYVYADGTLWFHCATEGHKVEAIRREPRVSFCVVDQDTVLPERFSTAYRSVIVFGTARIVREDAERRAAIQALTTNTAPTSPARRARPSSPSTRRTPLSSRSPPRTSAAKRGTGPATRTPRPKPDGQNPKGSEAKP